MDNLGSEQPLSDVQARYLNIYWGGSDCDFCENENYEFTIDAEEDLSLDGELWDLRIIVTSTRST